MAFYSYFVNSFETNLGCLSLKLPSVIFTSFLRPENMKRIVILIVLVSIAAVAGVVRSSVGSVAELRGLVSHKNTADVRRRSGRVTSWRLVRVSSSVV